MIPAPLESQNCDFPYTWCSCLFYGIYLFMSWSSGDRGWDSARCVTLSVAFARILPQNPTETLNLVIQLWSLSNAVLVRHGLRLFKTRQTLSPWQNHSTNMEIQHVHHSFHRFPTSFPHCTLNPHLQQGFLDIHQNLMIRCHRRLQRTDEYLSDPLHCNNSCLGVMQSNRCKRCSSGCFGIGLAPYGWSGQWLR